MNNIMLEESKLGKANKVKKAVMASALTSLLGVGILFGGGDAEASEHTYQVKQGDTLNQIAQENKVDLDKLVSLNKLANKNLIYEGQSINLNISDSVTKKNTEDKEVKEDKEATGIYTVKSGDTLFEIGVDFGVSVNQLKTWNNLSSDLIYVGQELSVSGETAQETEAPEVVESVNTNVFTSGEEQETQTSQESQASSVAPSVVEYEEVEQEEYVAEPQTQQKTQPVEQASSVAPTQSTQNTQTTQSTSNSGLNWGALASCESGGNASVVSSNGMYHGLYQFDAQTWQSVGGSGVASDASAAEQTQRAQKLYDQRGSSPWPVCGANL